MTTYLEITSMVYEACKSIKYNIDAIKVQRWCNAEGLTFDWHEASRALESLTRQYTVDFDGLNKDGMSLYHIRYS